MAKPVRSQIISAGDVSNASRASLRNFGLSRECIRYYQPGFSRMLRWMTRSG